MNYDVACIVDVGYSEKNDDRAMVNNTIITNDVYEGLFNDAVFAIVCDGVGGELFGGKAAEIALSAFRNENPDTLSEDRVKQLILKAESMVLNGQNKDSEHRHMSSTMAGIVVKNDSYIVFNLGDSRVYHYVQPYISQLSIDHTLCQEMKKLGLEPTEEHEHIITKYIGGKADYPFIFARSNAFYKGDYVVLCSDGISDVVTCDDFEEIISTNEKSTDICKKIIDLAKGKNSPDNLSVIVIKGV